MEDADPPRRLRGAVLADLAREDLELQGVEELAERVQALNEEIARTRAAIERKSAGRAAADAIFSLPSRG